MAEESKSGLLPSEEEMAAEKGQVSREMLVASVLAGTAFGAVMAMLYTPKNGQEVRSSISKMATDATGRVKDFSRKTQDQIMDTINSGKTAMIDRKTTIRSAFEAGRDVFRKGKEKIAA